MVVFERKAYLQELISGLGNDMVKIVTGIRRCGKSYLLFRLFKKYLVEHGVDEQHIIELTFEERENIALTDPDKLLSHIDAHLPKDNQTTVIMLDEVQMVREFVSVLLSLMHKPNVQVYCSGSNSKFLSSDVVTEFRGRGWEIRVHPLSFAEYYEGVGGDFATALNAYYRYGGLPGVALIESEEQKRQYLQSIYETAYLRDVIDRNHLRNAEGMRTLVQVIASSIGAPTNPSRIANTFKSELGITISSETIASYLRYLQDAFIISEALRYDVKGRKYIGASAKYFFEDVGIRNMLLNFRQQEDNHIMENIIYNELCLRGYAVDVGSLDVWEMEDGKYIRKNLEIDFVVNRAPERLYIQSTFALPTREKTIQEQRPLLQTQDNFRKIIVLGNIFQSGWVNDEGIQIMNIREFLLQPELLK